MIMFVVNFVNFYWVCNAKGGGRWGRKVGKETDGKREKDAERDVR